MNLYSAASKMRAVALIFARANWENFFQAEWQIESSFLRSVLL